MHIVLGIGNPGRRYENTRHNIGFLILNQVSELYKTDFKPSKFDFHYAEGDFEGSSFILIKPSTYVNNSGIAALQALEFFNTSIKDLLIVVDDINIKTGMIRVRASGGDGGHNGLKSIIYHLNSEEFPRIRIGIGSEFSKGEMADYVLSKFHKDDLPLIEEISKRTHSLIREFISGGTKRMLDYYSSLQN